MYTNRAGTTNLDSTSLFKAIKERDKVTIERLVHSNPDILFTARYGERRTTVLHESIGYGDRVDVDFVEFLLNLDKRVLDLKKEEPVGETALSAACYLNKLDVFRLLLERGADPVKCGYIGGVLAHDAVNKGDKELIRALAQREDANEAFATLDYQGNSPLMNAIKCNKADLIYLIIELNPSCLYSKPSGLMHNAVIIGNDEVVKFLLQFPVIQNALPIANNSGYSALAFAHQTSRTSIILMLRAALEKVEPNRAANDFIRQCQIVEETALVLGLIDGGVRVTRFDTQEEVEIYFSGGSHCFGLNILNSHLTEYVESLRCKQHDPLALGFFERISAAMCAEADYFQFDVPAREGFETLLKDYQKGKLLLL